MDTIEEWRSVSGKPSWQVSDMGGVRMRVDGEWVLVIDKMKANNKNYWTVQMKEPDDEQRKRGVIVHRAIATAFISEPPSPIHQVNHKNGIKRDNRLANLEWVTPSENSQHAWDTGLNGPVRNGVRVHTDKSSYSKDDDFIWEMPLRPILPPHIKPKRIHYP